LPGLYVPRSSFREASKEIMESATQGGTNIIDNNVGNTTGIKGWANQTVQNASQRVMNSVGKIIRRNVVHIKYGTLVYLIDESQIQQSSRINKK
jgi:plasmid transfer protein